MTLDPTGHDPRAEARQTEAVLEPIDPVTSVIIPATMADVEEVEVVVAHNERQAAGPIYDAVLPNLNRIRDALVPQFLQLGHDPDLVVNLSRLESAVRVWEGNLRRNQLCGTPSTSNGIAEVLDAVYEVLEYLQRCGSSAT